MGPALPSHAEEGGREGSSGRARVGLRGEQIRPRRGAAAAGLWGRGQMWS